jgi:hypothetical protein
MPMIEHMVKSYGVVPEIPLAYRPMRTHSDYYVVARYWSNLNV